MVGSGGGEAVTPDGVAEDEPRESPSSWGVRRTSSKATAFSNIALSCSPVTVMFTELLAAMVLDELVMVRARDQV